MPNAGSRICVPVEATQFRWRTRCNGMVWTVEFERMTARELDKLDRRCNRREVYR